MQDICFIHVPKTGGNSLLVDSVAVLGSVKVATEGPNFVSYCVVERPDLALTYIGHNCRVNNYMTIALYKKQHPDCFAFAVARNPYDRLVSAFHYLTKGGMNKWDRLEGIYYLGASRGDFRRFVLNAFEGPERPKIFRQMHLRPQVDWLCDETGRVMVDCLGRFESIHSVYEELGHRTGVPLPAPSHVNKSQHARYDAYYDETLRSLVARAYQADFERLGYPT